FTRYPETDPLPKKMPRLDISLGRVAQANRHIRFWRVPRVDLRRGPRFDSISATSRPNNAPYEFLTNLSGLFSLSAPILSLSGLHILASPGEVPMSLTVFLAFCILGCDFLLYALFQWIYGEKHKNPARRSAARRERRRALSAKEA